MKRRMAMLLLLVLLLAGAGRAESVMAELRNMRKSAGDRILELEPVVTPAPQVTPEPTPVPEVEYEPLSSGMKGDSVKDMQQRLIDLHYLTGKADGSYGAKTVAAVKAFQQSAGLEATGEADGETLKQLYFAQAPIQKNYQKLDYKLALNKPYTYRGTEVSFTGKVLQVLTDDTYANTHGVYTALRVATRGEFDDVTYVTLFRDPAAEPITEGDKVTVRGTAKKLYRYTTEAGDEITLPRIEADSVE